MITYGDEAATHTLDIYEDMRCPYCATLEHALGPNLRGLADQVSPTRLTQLVSENLA